jgi:hypothetical protein
MSSREVGVGVLKTVLGVILSLIPCAVIAIVSFLVGAALSQGARELEPATSLSTTTEALDRELTSAAASSRRTAAALLALRAEIDRVRRTAPQDGNSRPTPELLGELDRFEGRLWEQNQAFQTTVLGARDLARTQHDAIEETISRHGNPVARILTGIHTFVAWIGPALVFALLLFLLFILAMRNPRIRQFFGGSGSLAIAGVTLTFKDIGWVRSSVEDRIKELDRDISKVYRTNLAETDIDEAFERLKKEIDGLFHEQLGINLNAIKHRVNLFVPGFAGDELIQATPYYGDRMTVTRVGVGRRFSARYGMVGKCWRLGKPLYNPNVSNKGKALVREWGLMPNEADHQGQSTKSLMGLPLPGSGNAPPLGVVFLEATKAALQPADLSKTQLFGPNPPAPLDDDLFAKEIWERVLLLPAMPKLLAELEKLRKDLLWDEKVIGDPGR